MSLQRAVVFDLETVPDLMAGRELLHAAPEIPDAHVRRMLGERYARPAEDPDDAFVRFKELFALARSTSNEPIKTRGL